MSFVHSPRLLALALVSIGGLLAFSGCESPSSMSGQNSIRTLTTSANSNWVLVSLVTADGVKQPVPASHAPSLTIGYQGRVSGNAGVNDYVGNATVADDHLSWGEQLASTRMAGAPELMATENLYLTALKATTQITVNGDRLILTGHKPLRLEFVRANP